MYTNFIVFNHDNQSVGIPFDVEDIMLVSDVVNTVKCLYDIRKTFPFASFYNSSPFL